MRSPRAQLLTTLAALLVAAGVIVHHGPPPAQSLYDAVDTKDAEAVRLALRWGVHPDAVGPEDCAIPVYVVPPYPPKFYPPREPGQPIVREKDDLPTYVDFARSRPLVLAIMHGDLETVRLLVRAGAHLEVGRPVLLARCFQRIGGKDEEAAFAAIIIFLRQHGAAE